MGFMDTLKKQFNFKEAYNNIKDEQKAIANGTAGKFEYLAGHTNLVHGEVTVWKGDAKNTLEIQQMTGNKNHYIVDVVGIEWDEQAKRSVGKAAVGAILGGLLTGGVGVIAGAAVGGRRQDNSVAVVTYKDSNIEKELYFRADASKYQELLKLL